MAAPALSTPFQPYVYQPDAYLCSVNDVAVTPIVKRRARAGFFGSEGVLMQKLVGQGLAFIAAGGSACVVAMTSTVGFHVKSVGSARRAYIGVEGSFTAHLTGPGIVFIQSLPFHRLAQRIARAVTSPIVRDNPRFFIQIVIFFFFAYSVIVSFLLLTDV